MKNAGIMNMTRKRTSVFAHLCLMRMNMFAFAKSRIKPAAISGRVVLNMILYASKTNTNKMNSYYSSYFFAVDKYGIGVYNKNTLTGYKE